MASPNQERDFNWWVTLICDSFGLTTETGCTFCYFSSLVRCKFTAHGLAVMIALLFAGNN